MNIEDLLYHLQHPDSLDQLTVQEINALVLKYPYLDSLKSLYEIRVNGQPSKIDVLDLNQRMDQIASQAYQSDNNYTLSPTVFDLPVTNHIVEPVVELLLTKEENQVPQPAESIPEFEEKFQLYPYEESGFIRFLSALPPCKVNASLPLGISKPVAPELKSTEKMISASVDLQPNFGTESLADLWVVQGKIQEAISIYERLSYENPDKSAKFAAKIEKLKAENSL